MKRSLPFLALLLTASVFVPTQAWCQFPGTSLDAVQNALPRQQCAQNEIHEMRMDHDPIYRAEQTEREIQLNNFLNAHPAHPSGKSQEILTVPVVVHIIHDGDPYGFGSNITDAQVYSALEALNEDYRKTAGSPGDGNGVDTGIEFCLAQRDPEGNPTTGINRVNGCSVPLYCQEGIQAGGGPGANEMDVKNLSRWPNSDYYNIWVVSEIGDNNAASGIQGYAYFPTTSPIDGTVVLFNAFGTEGNLKSYTNLNRTVTHEIGHALGLYHTFQGGACSETDCSLQGDRICDTPPTILNTSCSSPACGNQQVENYMDYTPETCKNTFTAGQRDRMRASMNQARQTLLSSNACIPLATAPVDAGITGISAPTGNVCAGVVAPTTTLTNFGPGILTSATILYKTSGSWQSYPWTGVLNPNQAMDVALPDFDGGWGNQTLQIKTSQPNGFDDLNPNNDLAQSPYQALEYANPLTVCVTIDAIGEDITWVLRDQDQNITAQGGPYANGQPGNLYTTDLCLPDGCYQFTISDAAGDGICCADGQGSYQLKLTDGTVLASGGQFGAEQTDAFCLGVEGSPPTANFYAADINSCAGQAIDFVNTSTDAEEFHWTFLGGEPSTSTATNPSGIVYAEPGEYTVKLVAVNSIGSDTETKTGYIIVSAPGIFHADNDGDGHGDPTIFVVTCSPPDGYVSDASDCDDADPENWDGCYDCAGTMNGNAYTDECGTCDTNPDNDCVQDCAGDWGGDAYYDNCGVCDDLPENDCIQDCAGVWGGSAYYDDCGTCDGTPENDCTPCDGLSVSVSQYSEPTCHGALDGSITIEANSTDSSHHVVWNTGDTTLTVTNLGAGTYHVIVTDDTCSTFLEFVLGEPDALTLSFENLVPDDCTPSPTGSANLVITGGTSPYHITSGQITVTQMELTGLSAGQYPIVVRDAHQCATNDTLTIVAMPCDSLPEAVLLPQYCGQTQIDFFSPVQCTPVDSAQGYRWELVPETALNGGLTFDTDAPDFVPADIGPLAPGITYLARVKPLSSHAVSAYGTACEITFALPAPELLLTNCDHQTVRPNDLIVATDYARAERYEFAFLHGDSGTWTFIDTQGPNFVAMDTALLPHDFGEYTVSARIQHQDHWGSFGTECTVELTENGQLTTLLPPWCGNLSIDRENDLPKLQPIEGATVYEVYLTTGNPAYSPITLRIPSPYITTEKLALLAPNRTYNTSCRALANGQWTAWGPSCKISLKNGNFPFNLQVYPMPIDQGQNIQMRMKGNRQNVSLRIIDLTGKTQLTATKDFEHLQPTALPSNGLPPGLYLLQAEQGGQSLTKKLVIQ